MGASPPLRWEARRSELAPEDFCSQRNFLISQILWQRGLTNDKDIEVFLNPRLESLQNPFRLQNLEGAALRLARAITNQESIVVYGDYDIDGMSGLALLASFFRACGAENVSTYQPERLEEGYGVHPEAMRKLAAAGAQVIVTVDTGIAALEAAKEAKSLGVDLIITDHHQQILDLPEAAFVVNPNQFTDTSGLGYLSGTGVAFYLALALRVTLRSQGTFATRPEPDIKNWLDLFVLGTIADSVSLVGENRILVKAGLAFLPRSQRPGLKALMAKCLANPQSVSVRDVGFSIAPKLNAASRLGRADLSTKLLLTTSIEEAESLVEEILDLNTQRSSIQAQVFAEAQEQALRQIEVFSPPVLVVHGAWHEGVLGIVAAKLVEKFGRPSIVLGKHGLNKVRGSMRTLEHFSCIRALESCKDLLIKYGGHRMAAGMQLAQSDLEDFCTELWKGASSYLNTLSESPPLKHDGILPRKLGVADIEAIEALGPWGNGNPEPLFLLENFDFEGAQVLKEEHIKCKSTAGLELIGFFKAKELRILQMSGNQKFDVLVTPEINRFRGAKSVQLRLQYVRSHEADSSRT